MGPLRFRWGEDPDTGQPLFQCDLQCLQCAGTTRQGVRCRRNTCMYLPYCRQHLKSELHLEVRGSGFGLGLFAESDPHNPGRVVFHPGNFIASLDGEPLTKDQLDLRYGPDEDNEIAPYGAVANEYLYDGACRRGVGQYANTAVQLRDPRRLRLAACNADLVARPVDMYNQPTPGVYYSWLRARRNIVQGEEIIAFYGSLHPIDDITYLNGKTFGEMWEHSTRR